MKRAVWATKFLNDISMNIIIRDAKNNGRAPLNEKARSDHLNDEDNVNVSTKFLVM